MFANHTHHQELLILQHQWGEVMRQSEHDMDIGDRQKFILASRDPAIASPVLALGAVAIPAAVIGEGLIATARTMVAMSTPSCGTATSNGLEHLAVSPVDPAAVVLDEAIALCANDIGHLERWPSHFFSSLRERWPGSRLESSSVWSGLVSACRCLRDRCR